MDLGLGQPSSLIEEFKSLVFLALPVLDLTDQAVEPGVCDIEAKRAPRLGSQNAEISTVACFVQLTGNFTYQGLYVQRVERKGYGRRFALKKPT
ncbi:hypothetical protein [Mesorhizobium cantuariense]|uniref:Uncharacterized protein n=1 Tax=Mesorhizobium cantuariense TaxID=1300275 RepID=A0ABV7MK36_9HYPH